MTAVHESLRAPIENNDNTAPREDRVRYGAANPPSHHGGGHGHGGLDINVILVLGGLTLVALFLIVLLTAAYWELWFGVHPATGY